MFFPPCQMFAPQEMQGYPSSKRARPSPQALERAGGPISLLQEFVQGGDRRFPVPANRPILQWQFDTRMATAVKLEFRATVSFLLEGVPHHAAGGWHSSKKAAQRDAAERILGFLHGHWVDFSANCKSKVAATDRQCTPEPEAAADRLAAFCASLSDNCNGDPLQWRCHSSGEGCQALVDLNIFGGMVHTLQGDVCPDFASAREDTARRALWYLQCPGFENAFKVSEEAVAEETLAVPPESDWQRNGAERDQLSESQQRAAEQKTLIMRLQNRLQRLFAKQLPQNNSVWEWFYDYSSEDAVVPLCRARVRLSVVNREFEGRWCQGQKAAQLDVCSNVEAFLDSEEVSEDKASGL